MGNRILIIAVSIFLLAGAVMAEEFTVIKVIAADSANPAPGPSPLKWSSDGSQLAYFQRGYLMVWDTSGNSHRVAHPDLTPVKFEWLSDKEIIVAVKGMDQTMVTERLSVFNTVDGAETRLDGYSEDISATVTADTGVFDGPFLSLEGKACYFDLSPDANALIFPPSQYETGQRAVSEKDNHILRWGANGLYIVQGDMGDSVRIARKPFPGAMQIPAINSDRSFIMMGGVLERLADSAYIDLDKLVKDGPPAAEGCGIHFGSFNPKYGEVVFQIGCPFDETYFGNRIGLYDMKSSKITILDTLVKRDNCTYPVHAPDGKRIAFISKGVAYVVYRDLKKDQ